ncbi:MAG: MBOAT family O-acyltransferase [Saprospiraceae bacterium]|nr:MBOAT family O-acyltransferase [Saprospiraceae bacterium]
MIFNSLTFLVFMVLAVALYWSLGTKWRLWMIFLMSLVFYGFWRVEFIGVMLLSTVTDYFVSLELGKDKHSPKTRKRLLIISLTVNLGLLFIFKYLLFFADNTISLINWLGWSVNDVTWKIILPLGISFYTFQTLSYTIDVYRRHYEPVRNFALYASYVTFFPQLVAGPVLRAAEVVEQLKRRPTFQLPYIEQGLKRILYGLFLKVVLADNIAPIVDTGFGIDATQYGGLDVWTLSFLFGMQIYFDFAGYSHIAIGCAKLMGIEFPENFNFPYAARSFKEFWKRWHISLSSWIRDYLYLPLAGIKVLSTESRSKGGLNVTEGTRKSKNTALFLTWAIMGFWHGANWTFILWGIYHSVMIFAERLINKLTVKRSIKINKRVAWIATLGFAMLGWVPFRAENLGDAFTMFSKIFIPSTYLQMAMRENVYLITALITLLVIAAYELDRVAKRYDWEQSLVFAPAQVLKYTTMIVLVYIFFRPINQFIYFQF